MLSELIRSPSLHTKLFKKKSPVKLYSAHAVLHKYDMMKSLAP